MKKSMYSVSDSSIHRFLMYINSVLGSDMSVLVYTDFVFGSDMNVLVYIDFVLSSDILSM